MLQELSLVESEKSLGPSILKLISHQECQNKWTWLRTLALCFASRIAGSDMFALLDVPHWIRLSLATFVWSTCSA